MALQALEQTAVTMAQQMLNHQRIRRVVRRLCNPDVKQTVAGVGVRAFAVVLHVALERLTNPGQLFITGIHGRQRRGFGLNQTTGLEQGKRRNFRAEIHLDAQFRVQFLPLIARDLRHHRFIGHGFDWRLTH